MPHDYLSHDEDQLPSTDGFMGLIQEKEMDYFCSICHGGTSVLDGYGGVEVCRVCQIPYALFPAGNERGSYVGYKYHVVPNPDHPSIVHYYWHRSTTNCGVCQGHPITDFHVQDLGAVIQIQEGNLILMRVKR